MSATKEIENDIKAMKKIRQKTRPNNYPTKPTTNQEDTKEQTNSTSEMPGLEEHIREAESSDDDSDNYSETQQIRFQN